MSESQGSDLRGDSAHLRVDPDERSQLLKDELEHTQSAAHIYRIDYSQQTYLPISMSEAISYSEAVNRGEFIFLCFVALEPAQIRQVRRAFRLHLVLEAECAPSIFNIKDSVFTLPDHTLLTLSELDENYDRNLAVKIVLRSRSILLFASKLPFSLRAICDKSEVGSDHVISAVPIEDDSECDTIAQVLYRLLEANTHRIELYVLKIISEAKLANVYASELSYRERVDFIQRINIVKKGMILADESIRLKASFFSAFRACPAFPTSLEPYALSLQIRNQTMSLQIASSYKLVKDAESMYTATVDDALANGSNRLNNIMKRYAALSVMFLPLNVLAGYFGMNVTIPWEAGGNLNAFIGICLLGLLLFLLMGTVFRCMRWL